MPEAYAKEADDELPLLIASKENEDVWFFPDNAVDFDDFSADAFDAWMEARAELNNDIAVYRDKLDFFNRVFLDGIEAPKRENLLFSPLSVLFSMELLVETTEGETQRQILDAVGVENTDAFRMLANTVRRAYLNAGQMVGNALWLAEDVVLPVACLKNVSEYGYASVYRGEMDSKAMQNAYEEWMSTQTDGMLHSGMIGLKPSPDVKVMMTSALSGHRAWQQPFDPVYTKSGEFFIENEILSCNYMYTELDGSVTTFEKGIATCVPFENSGSMLILLPNKGISPEQLLNDGEIMDWLISGGKTGSVEYAEVCLSLPKIEYTSVFDLKPLFSSMDITHVFNPALAECLWTNRAGNANGLSGADHSAVIRIDEQGVSTAAVTRYTSEVIAALPDKRVEFCVNRPWLFGIVSEENLLLYVGIVNTP